MKKLLALEQDFIIETRFVATQIKDENTGQYNPDWLDDKKEKANGKLVVDNIIMLVPQYDREGYMVGSYQKVGIAKSDILKIAEDVLKTESEKLTGHPKEDLPF